MAFVSEKINTLPPYLFSEFQKKKKALEEKGVDVIDLGIGAPDLPTPEFVIDRLVEEVRNPLNHRYSTYSGVKEFRQAVADFYKDHYKVDLDPDTEVLALIGSKEGIANLVQAVVNPGDTVLVPNPGYPVYRTAVHLAGANSVDLPLDAVNGYQPLFDQVSKNDAIKAKLMFLNYPSNPTAATVNSGVFLKAVSFARNHQMIVANDAAYDLVTFDDYQAPSILQAPEAKDYAVEFGSLSKSFNMTGWRIGYLVGNKTVVKALSTLKSNIDTSQFLPIQRAAATALKSDLETVKANNKVYQERMEKLLKAFHELGIEAERPKGTIFVWAKVPNKYTSESFANQLLEHAGVIVTPGSAFGSVGKGYIRIALSVTSNRLDEVIKRMKSMSIF
ncbi:LL-diaminopimelate aminotransferase [Virgibacillus phasianinus]|uniref:Aminotransferase n=1 Tax=Virgibacillus phasianinus TaxID=2017483 RepID=A0A220TZ09_9BACI|nr:LL-diaminopimelate aminotransferase [Virgibacillus phasianinus]ASK61108.1 LL-diaminopimelate aminotransferase [Virgibacillus phasianinus]